MRRLDSALTYESFDHTESAGKDDNGEIWSATLWEVREAIGRDKAGRINLYRSAHLAALRRIFRRGGIGPDRVGGDGWGGGSARGARTPV